MSAVELVSLSVRARVGNVEVRRFEAREELVGGWQEPDYQDWPAAVIASLPVTLLFGDGPPSKAPRRTKRLSHRVFLLSAEEPTEAEWLEAERTALQGIAAQAVSHGLAPPEPP